MAYSADNQYFEDTDGVYIEYINKIKDTLFPLLVINEYPADVKNTNKFNDLGITSVGSNHDLSIVELENADNYGSYIELRNNGLVKFNISSIVNNFDKWKRITAYNTDQELLKNIQISIEGTTGNELATVSNGSDLEEHDIDSKDILFSIKNNSSNINNTILVTEFLQKGYNSFLDVNNVYNYGEYLNTVFNKLNNNLLIKTKSLILKTRTINGKSLENDINLNANDIKAYKKPDTNVLGVVLNVNNPEHEETIISSGVPYHGEKIIIEPLKAPQTHNILRVNSLTTNNPDFTILKYSFFKNNIYFLVKCKKDNISNSFLLNAVYEYNEV